MRRPPATERPDNRWRRCHLHIIVLIAGGVRYLLLAADSLYAPAAPLHLGARAEIRYSSRSDSPPSFAGSSSPACHKRLCAGHGWNCSLALREIWICPAANFGVHSEVGQPAGLVCAPGRAHQRLTPSNCDDLLFDDVLWVENAKRDHFDFIAKDARPRDRSSKCNMLAETVAIPEARKWILDNQVTANQVGVGLVDNASYLEGLEARDLAETLIGGLPARISDSKHGGACSKWCAMPPASPISAAAAAEHALHPTRHAGSTAA